MVITFISLRSLALSHFHRGLSRVAHVRQHDSMSDLVLLGAVMAVATALFVTIEGVPIIDGLHWAVQTVSSVGYGDAAPKSVLGKLVSMAAALAGTVLFGAVTALSLRWRASTAAALGVAVLGVGAVFFSAVEGWTVFDGLYFSVITATTVGYGDLTVSTPAGRIGVFVFICLACGPVARLAATGFEAVRGLARASGRKPTGVAKANKPKEKKKKK